MRRAGLILIVATLSAVALAQQAKVIPAKGASSGDKSTVSMEHYPGGSVVTDMGIATKSTPRHL